MATRWVIKTVSHPDIDRKRQRTAALHDASRDSLRMLTPSGRGRAAALCRFIVERASAAVKTTMAGQAGAASEQDFYR